MFAIFKDARVHCVVLKVRAGTLPPLTTRVNFNRAQKEGSEDPVLQDPTACSHPASQTGSFQTCKQVVLDPVSSADGMSNVPPMS